MRLLVLTCLLTITAACSTGGGTTPLADEASPTPRPRPLPEPARSSAEVDEVFHVGQEVFITDEGMKPKQLVAVVAEAISFINESSEPRTVIFDVIDFRTKAIPPGGRAKYTPRSAYAIAYHLAEDPDVKGQVQVEPYFDPGEDPAAEGRYDADTPDETTPATPSP